MFGEALGTVFEVIGIIALVYFALIEVGKAIVKAAQSVSSQTKTKKDDELVSRVNGIVLRIEEQGLKINYLLERTIGRDLNDDGQIGAPKKSINED